MDFVKFGTRKKFTYVLCFCQAQALCVKMKERNLHLFPTVRNGEKLELAMYICIGYNTSSSVLAHIYARARGHEAPRGLSAYIPKHEEGVLKLIYSMVTSGTVSYLQFPANA